VNQAVWAATRVVLSGIFAVGDVRGGNIKRVASAVGEGSIAVAFVHPGTSGVSEVPRNRLERQDDARRSVRDDSDDVVALALRPEVTGCDPS
jgi:hypothetical protein